jgi:hypothetical protein
MAATFLFIIPFLFNSLIPLVSAIPNVTVIPVGPGDCSGFPSSYPTSGRNADAFIFRPDQADNSSINNLKTIISGNSLVVSEDSTVDNVIFCCDHGGTVEDGFGYLTLLLPTNSSNMQLSYMDEGSKPMTYAHEVNGVRQDGVYLGSGNVTTWAFKRVANARHYQIRLFAPGTGTTKGNMLNDGEFKGFLKVTAP